MEEGRHDAMCMVWCIRHSGCAPGELETACAGKLRAERTGEAAAHGCRLSTVHLPRGLGDRRVSLCATQRGFHGHPVAIGEMRARPAEPSAWRKSGQSNKPTSRPSTTLRCLPRPPHTAQRLKHGGQGGGATPVGLPGTPVRATVRYTWRVGWCMVWCLRYSVTTPNTDRCD